MVQLWIENKIFQIRIVSEKENESPGILAKTEVNVELKSDWNQARGYITLKILAFPKGVAIYKKIVFIRIKARFGIGLHPR